MCIICNRGGALIVALVILIARPGPIMMVCSTHSFLYAFWCTCKTEIIKNLADVARVVNDFAMII